MSRDWREIDRQRRADDWRYAGEFLMQPFAAIWAAAMLVVIGFVLCFALLGAVLVRLAPLIVSVFAAIMLARCMGVL